MRMDITTKRAAWSAAVVVAALVSTAISGCSASQGSVSSTATGASSPSVAPSSPARATAPVPSGTTRADEGPVSLPDELFQDGGMTLNEYSTSDQPGTQYIDTASETVVKEGVGTGEYQVTLDDARRGERYRVQLVCPSDATGKSDVYVSDSPTSKGQWQAGSEAMCGDWSAGLPPRQKDGPFTVTVQVENDRPFRVAVTKLLGG
ncbi:hypothetical protein M3D16_004240 [Micrococcus luteus]|uniref:hypothetical protein n=1 Tax=Micrococcus luteus TaxID=1270 RepID=UPI001395E281|nr:hypothetical protein [Micrococcus luteus]MCV7515665.1 hypothetical protein [Micrococcus luteus]